MVKKDKYFLQNELRGLDTLEEKKIYYENKLNWINNAIKRKNNKSVCETFEDHVFKNYQIVATFAKAAFKDIEELQNDGGYNILQCIVCSKWFAVGYFDNHIKEIDEELANSLMNPIRRK